MIKFLPILLIGFTFLGCLTAPELSRDNIKDRNAGIPYIHNFSYKVDGSGLLLNWIDGSIQNDVFILEQRIFDNSSNQSDSLVKITELENDRTFFLDSSLEFGYPYTVYIKSHILDGNRVKAEVIDTLEVNIGRLTYQSQYSTNDLVFFNWQTIRNYSLSDSILVEKFETDHWRVVTFLDPRAQSYSIEKESLTGNDRFRVSSTVENYNGKLSRTSSFEVIVDE